MGRKKTLCRGVADAWGPVAATAGGADGRAGMSSVLGWFAGPGAAARKLGWLAGRLLLRASWAG